MLLPLKDLNPTRTFPFVNYALIAANVIAFVWETLLIGQNGDAAVVAGYGLVATRLLSDPTGELFTVFTSMFMHGGLAHLAGNMLSLYIFGDNVEDALGHRRYLAFYLLAGVAAAAGQVLTGLGSPVAMVGASGAIAGVMGAYVVLYPRAPILCLLLFIVITVPAWLTIGLWFALNLTGGLHSLGLGSMGGVAFFAHIGGFIAGLILIRPLMVKPRAPAFEWAGWRPPPRLPVSRSRYEAWRDR